MDPQPNDEPSLDHVLLRDFSEMGVGEGNLKTMSTVNNLALEKDDENQEPTSSSIPTTYNQVIDAVEDRTSFVVGTPPAVDIDQAETPDSTPATQSVPVLSAPTSTLGDDFDVNW